ncbi:MAG: hypothetical protein CM1200mP20_09540 [Pseudomonadota bacterium]|nr:MAG: hypothetical protein CM1200mP20_09540 [Pseudomonadota bacterium]
MVDPKVSNGQLARTAREPDILPLEVDGLGYAIRGQWFLKDVGFTLEAGRRTCIVGPNGAGKSLLLRLCHGLFSPAQAPSAGPQALPAGDADSRRWSSRIRCTCAGRLPANVEFALSVQGLDRRAIRERTAWVLEATGLDHLAGRPARVLSGGEQQRPALARAWALRPRVLSFG